MSKQLPPNPNLEFDKKQAKALLKAYRAQAPEAVQRVKFFHPRLQHSFEQQIPSGDFSLSDAQLVIAREYGFSSWPQLKHRIESLRAGLVDAFEQFANAMQSSDTTRVKDLLQKHPALKKHLDDPVIGFDGPAVLTAAGCQNLELLDLLLENGADINAKSAWWAGSFAVMHGASAKMVKALEERGAKWDIFSAAEQDRMDLVREFLETDSSLVNAKGPDGQHPLHFARSLEMIDYLLAQGAELDARDLDHAGTAAQWLAAEHPKLTKHLLEKGAETDIFMLSRLGELERLKSLLDASPELLNKRIGHADYPAVPLAPGQHIYVYTFGDNKSAHQLAKQYQQQEIYEFLLERSSVERRFVAACERGDGESMKALLDSAPDLPKRLAKQDQVLLVDAAWNRQLEAVKLMLEAGFDPHIQSQDGSTALHSAAFHGFSDIVKLLLNYNPALELRNDYGARPLESALYGTVHSWRPEGDFPATVEALLRAGSKPAPDVQATGNAAVDALLQPYLKLKNS